MDGWVVAWGRRARGVVGYFRKKILLFNVYHPLMSSYDYRVGALTALEEMGGRRQPKYGLASTDAIKNVHVRQIGRSRQMGINARDQGGRGSAFQNKTKTLIPPPGSLAQEAKLRQLEEDRKQREQREQQQQHRERQMEHQQQPQLPTLIHNNNSSNNINGVLKMKIAMNTHGSNAYRSTSQLEMKRTPAANSYSRGGDSTAGNGHKSSTKKRSTDVGLVMKPLPGHYAQFSSPDSADSPSMVVRRGQRSKKSNQIRKKSETIDLVSDEDDDDDDGDEEEDMVGMKGFADRMEQDMDGPARSSAPTLRTKLNDNTEFENECSKRIGPYNELYSAVQVDRLYLGKKQVCNNNGVSAKLFVRITQKGLEMDVPTASHTPMHPNMKDEKAELTDKITILLSEINRSYATKDTNADKSVCFIAFDILGVSADNVSLTKHVSVGQGRCLHPGSKNTILCPAQYVLLVLDGPRATQRFKTLSKQLNACSRDFRSKLVQEVTDAMLYAETASDEKKLKWIDEAQAEMVRHERTASRLKRRRSTTSGALEIGEQEGDGDTYLVYPCVKICATDERVDKEKDKRISITKGDMRRLDPPMYLNDTLIDFKIQHMLQSEFSSKRSLVHCFQSFFYTRLTDERNIEEGYKNVATWTKAVDIFEKDMIILPVNHTSHWSVLFLLRPKMLLHELSDESQASGAISENPESPCILCLDSLSMHNTKSIVSKTRGYLLQEFLNKKCGGKKDDTFLAFKAAVETLPIVSMKDIPTQSNGYDCGMYIIKYVEIFLRSWPNATISAIDKKFKGMFTGKDQFSEEDITLARVQMRRLLEQMKPDYDKMRAVEFKEEAEEREERRKKKKITVATVTVNSD